MTPGAQKFYLQRIKPHMAFLLVATTTLCWAVMCFFSFFVVTEIASEAIGILQDIFITLWLWSLGVFGAGKNQYAKLITVVIAGLVLVFPFLNDLPAEIVEMIALIIIVNREDVEIAEGKARAEKRNLAAKEQQAANDNKARAAQARAEQQRQQALAISMTAAQSDTPQSIAA